MTSPQKEQAVQRGFIEVFTVLRADPWARFMVSMQGLVTVLFVVEVSGILSARPWFLPIPLLFAAAAAYLCLPRSHAVRDPEERRFWTFLVLATLAWMANFTTVWAFSESARSVGAVAVGLSAFFLVLAVDTRTHLRRRSESLFTFGEFEEEMTADSPDPFSPAGFFVIALWIYLRFLPLLLEESSEGAEPSVVFPMLLTGYLLARALGRVVILQRIRWRMFYGLLASVFFLVLLRILWLFHRNVPDDLLTAESRWTWSLAFCGLAIAARLQTKRFTSGRPMKVRSPGHKPAWAFLRGDPGLGLAAGLATLGFGLLCPFLHFMGYRLGMLDPRLAARREVLVLLWLILFAALAGWRYVRLERGARDFWLRRTEEIKNLRSGAEDLRVLVEHEATAKQQRLSDRYFELAFQDNPYAMSIHRLADGKILKVNGAFEELLGWSGEEAAGRGPRELKLHESRRTMAKLWRALVDRGRFIETEVLVRTRSGESLSVFVSASRLVVDMESTALVIYRRVPQRRVALQRLWARSRRLDRSRAAVFAADLDGRILYWNMAARDLVGLTESASLGRLFSTVLNTPEAQSWHRLAHRAHEVGLAGATLELNTRERWKLRVEVWAVAVRQSDRMAAGDETVTLFFFSPAPEHPVNALDADAPSPDEHR